LRAPSRDKNPTKRRLYLPILDGNGNGHGNGEHVADTHVAHSIGCSQTAQPVGRRPDWLRVKAKFGPNFRNLKKIMNDLELHTVCEEAGCPNIFECWEEREATFLILGDRCTRRCGFCDVQTAKPLAVDEEEPEKIARAVGAMGLRHVVLTSVARDDLPDGGARIWAACIRAIRAELPECGVEVLTPDFKGDRNALATVMDAEPDVFALNLETVKRLHARIRPAFGYERTLEVLRAAKDLRSGQFTKSGLILGMGEHNEEVLDSLHDLRDAEVDLVTLSQYLQPTKYHLPVDRWVTPEEFRELADEGMAMGFAHVESGPLVRSSYHAGKQLARAVGR
jgi:lipoic acid synthetase